MGYGKLRRKKEVPVLGYEGRAGDTGGAASERDRCPLAQLLPASYMR